MKIGLVFALIGTSGCSFVANCGPLRPTDTAVTGSEHQGGASKTPPAATSPQTWFVEGQAALQAGNLDAAEADFRKVAAADPGSAAAYANLGVIAMRRKQWDRALTLLQKAERLDPK